MEDGSSFFNYMRMEPLRIGSRIQKSDTNFRKALEQGLELARTPRAYRNRGRSFKVDYAKKALSPWKRVGRSEVVARS